MMADIKRKVPNLRFKGFTDDWEQRKLGDFGSVAMNKRIFKKQTTEVGDVPFYKIGTFGKKPDAYISNELFEEYKSKYPYPKEGDLLISASGSIGRIVEYKGQKAYYQDSNIVWLKHNDQLNNLFLKAFYQIVKWDGTEGSTIKRLYNKNILRTRIFLPTTLEQEKVGNIIECIERLLTLQQRKLDLLKQLKKGFLQKMFAEKNSKQPILRFKGFHDDWEQRKLGEITKTHSFKQYISEAFDHGKYMVIQQGENPIAGYANGDPFENFKDVTLFGDHTLSLFKPQEKFFVASDGIKILSPSLKMNGMFYYYLLEKYRPQSEGYKRHFTIMKKSTALFPIEIDEQIKISNFLEELDSLIALHQRKQNHLKLLKKSLLQQMFM